MMMKSAAFIFLILLPLSLFGQSWEILNSDLKAEIKGDKILLSFLDDRESVLLNADTAYMDQQLALLCIENKGLLGLVDPVTLEILQEANFRKLYNIESNYLLVEVENGFFLARNEFPLEPLTDEYLSVDKLLSNAEQSIMEDDPLLVKKGTSFGILLPSMDGSYLVEPKYDEIKMLPGGENDFFYALRKGSKWGAGSCEGVEVEPAYDRIILLDGSCNDASFLVSAKGKSGVLRSGNPKPVIPLEYQKMTFFLNDNRIYLFGLDNEIITKLFVSDNNMEWYETFKPLLLLKIPGTGKSYLVYDDGRELFKLELSNKEIDQAGLEALKWLYLE